MRFILKLLYKLGIHKTLRLENTLAKYQWFRKNEGGKWYHNRYASSDAHKVVWERRKGLCSLTIETEIWNNEKSKN